MLASKLMPSDESENTSSLSPVAVSAETETVCLAVEAYSPLVKKTSRMKSGQVIPSLTAVTAMPPLTAVTALHMQVDVHICRPIDIMATWRTTCAMLSLAALCPPSSAIKILEGGDACDRDLANPDEMCCGLKTFNVKTSFCCGGIPVHIPCIGADRNCTIRPPGYDVDKQTCLFGETITKEAPCCPGEERHFCCGGEVRDLPIKECVLDNVYKDEVCCGEFRIRGDFASCCAERFPYIAEHEMCCGTFVAPREGYSTDSYSYPDSVLEMMDTTKQICIGGNVLRRNSSAEDKIGYCCGTEIVPKVSPTTPPPTTAKPTPVCGSKSYDPSRFICCSGYPYPISVYLCCEGQVQGKPVYAACCGRYAYSRLGHHCVRGREKHEEHEDQDEHEEQEEQDEHEEQEDQDEQEEQDGQEEQDEHEEQEEQDEHEEQEEQDGQEEQNEHEEQEEQDEHEEQEEQDEHEEQEEQDGQEEQDEHKEQEEQDDISNRRNKMSIRNRRNKMSMRNRRNKMNMRNRRNKMSMRNRRNKMDRRNKMSMRNRRNKMDRRNKMSMRNRRNKMDRRNKMSMRNRRNKMNMRNRRNKMSMRNRRNKMDRRNKMSIRNRRNKMSISNRRNKMRMKNRRNKMSMRNKRNKMSRRNRRNR
ncbi:hypothetical protein LSAT2_022032 [Lamellibrachia satsuma]|nr:hypothetical protein LSAT2_022032 [Lamellibrachia satsuma]